MSWIWPSILVGGIGFIVTFILFALSGPNNFGQSVVASLFLFLNPFVSIIVLS